MLSGSGNKKAFDVTRKLVTSRVVTPLATCTSAVVVLVILGHADVNIRSLSFTALASCAESTDNIHKSKFRYQTIRRESDVMQ